MWWANARFRRPTNNWAAQSTPYESSHIHPPEYHISLNICEYLKKKKKKGAKGWPSGQHEVDRICEYYIVNQPLKGGWCSFKTRIQPFPYNVLKPYTQWFCMGIVLYGGFKLHHILVTYQYRAFRKMEKIRIANWAIDRVFVGEGFCGDKICVLGFILYLLNFPLCEKRCI